MEGPLLCAKLHCISATARSRHCQAGSMERPLPANTTGGGVTGLAISYKRIPNVVVVLTLCLFLFGDMPHRLRYIFYGAAMMYTWYISRFDAECRTRDSAARTSSLCYIEIKTGVPTPTVAILMCATGESLALLRATAPLNPAYGGAATVP